jgi:hypothetical protein
MYQNTLSIVRNSKSNSGPEEAIANLQTKMRTIIGKIIEMRQHN